MMVEAKFTQHGVVVTGLTAEATCAWYMPQQGIALRQDGCVFGQPAVAWMESAGMGGRACREHAGHGMAHGASVVWDDKLQRKAQG